MREFTVHFGIEPDVVILDWGLPLLNSAEPVRIVRSPDVFPVPHVPIVVPSSCGERWRAVEAPRVGVNEHLVKPMSAKALHDRIVAILADPHPIVRRAGPGRPAGRLTAPGAVAGEIEPRAACR